MKNNLSIEEIEEIKDNEWVVFSTSKDNTPHSIIVMPSRVESYKIILSSIQMVKTIENLKTNNKGFIGVYLKSKDDKQYKIDCLCEILNEGKLFNEIKNYEEENNLPEELKVNSIIICKFEKIEICLG